MKRPPTDLEILEEIYKRYYREFVSFDKNAPSRSTKLLVPIDIDAIAKHFGIDKEIVFGRLYYHLDPKYRFKQDDGATVHFFFIGVGKDRHCVQFPLLCSIIASLREERNKHLLTAWLSIAALIISVFSLGISLNGGDQSKAPEQRAQSSHRSP